MKAIPLILTLLTCISITCMAQSPSAILVMLKAETNRISALKQKGDAAKVAQVIHDAGMVMDRTINDFTDNFHYCAVYYFMDTNLHLIKSKNFDGVLFDKDRKVYSPSPISTGDTSFFIVYYGIEMPEIERAGNAPEKQNVYRDPGSLKYDRGLVISGHNFMRMKKPKEYFLKRRDPKKLADPNSPYEYMSEEFRVSYIQCAEWPGRVLEKTYNR